MANGWGSAAREIWCRKLRILLPGREPEVTPPIYTDIGVALEMNRLRRLHGDKVTLEVITEYE